MVWTYNSSNAGSSDLAWVRMTIGDNSSAFPLMQDEEITAIVGDVGDKYWGAARCARMLAGQFARRVDKSAGRLRINASQAAKQYLDLADRLEQQAALRSAPYAGGISVADKQTRNSDSDRVLPQFRIGETDLPPSGSPWGSSTELAGWP